MTSRLLNLFPRYYSGIAILPSFSVYEDVRFSKIMPLEDFSVIGTQEKPFTNGYFKNTFTKIGNFDNITILDYDDNRNDIKNIFQEKLTLSEPLHWYQEPKLKLSLNKFTSNPPDYEPRNNRIELKMSSPFYTSSEGLLSLMVESPLKIANNALSLIINTDYLSIDTSNGKLRWDLPATVGVVTIQRRRLGDVEDGSNYPDDYVWQTNVGVDDGIGLSSDGLRLVHKLKAGNFIEITEGGLISCNYEFDDKKTELEAARDKAISDVEFAGEKAELEIDIKKTTSLGEITTATSASLAEIATATGAAVSSIGTSGAYWTASVSLAGTGMLASIGIAAANAHSNITYQSDQGVNRINEAKDNGLSEIFTAKDNCVSVITNLKNGYLNEINGRTVILENESLRLSTEIVRLSGEDISNKSRLSSVEDRTTLLENNDAVSNASIVALQDRCTVIEGVNTSQGISITNLLNLTNFQGNAINSLNTDLTNYKTSNDARSVLIETKNSQQDTSIALKLDTSVYNSQVNQDVRSTASPSFNTLSINSTVDSTSSTTGCLQLKGGIGISKNVFVGGFIVTPAFDNWMIGKPFDPFTSGKYNGLGRWFFGMEANNLVLGIPTLPAKSFSVSGYNADSTRIEYFKVSGDGVVSVNFTNDTTSISTASFVVNGGIGVAKNMFIGGLINCTTAPVQTQHLTNKNYVDTQDNLRVLTTTYNSYVSTNDANVGSRLPTSTFTSYVSSNDANVNSRVLTTTYNDYISANDNLNNTQNSRLTSVENRTTSIETDNVKKTYVDSQDNLRVLSSTYNSQINQDVRSSATPTFVSISLPSTNASTYGWSNGTGLCYAVASGQYSSNAVANDIILRTISTGNLRFGTSSGLATLNILNNGTVSILTTNDTTSISSGSFIVNGGIGISKNMFIGGLINCTTAPAQSQHLTNKNYVDTGLNLRVLQTTYDSYVSSNDANVGSRLPTSTFTSYVSSNDANVNSRVLTTTYNDYISANDTLNNTQNSRLTSIENRATSIETDNVKKSYVDSQDNLRVLSTTYNSQINQDVRNSAIPTFGGVVLPITSSSSYQWSTGGGLGYAQGVSNYSSNALAGDLILRTTSSATSTNNIRIGTSSGVATLNILQNGNVSILTTADSTSKTTGSLILSGGLAVAKTIYCSSLDVIGVGGTNATSMIDLSTYVPVTNPSNRILCTDDSNYSARMDFQSKVSGSENNALTTKLSILTNGVISIPTTTDASGVNTGVLQVSGGAYIAKNLFLTGSELNFSNAGGTRIKISSTGNNYFIGAVASDNAGDFHVYNAVEGGRIFGWYRNTNTVSLGYASGNSLVQIAGTTDATSNSTGSLQVNGGVGIGKNLYVGGIISTTSISLSSTIPISIGTLYQHTVETNSLTTNNPNCRSYVIKQTSTGDQYDLLELKSKTGESVFQTQFNNGNTTIKTSLFLKAGVISFGSQTSASQNVCNIGATGTSGGNDACMNFAVNSGSANDNMFKFYQIGSPNNPLAVITSSGDLRCNNFTSRNSAVNFSQSGVTFDTVVKSECDFSKMGRHMMVTYYFTWQNSTGMATGRFTFTLPAPARFTTKIRGVLVADGNSYSNNKTVNYNVDLTELSGSATIYSDMASNLPPGGGGGLTFTFMYPTA